MAPQVFEFSRFYCMLFTMVSFLVWLVCGWHADKPALLVRACMCIDVSNNWQAITKQTIGKLVVGENERVLSAIESNIFFSIYHM